MESRMRKARLTLSLKSDIAMPPSFTLVMTGLPESSETLKEQRIVDNSCTPKLKSEFACFAVKSLCAFMDMPDVCVCVCVCVCV